LWTKDLRKQSCGQKVGVQNVSGHSLVSNAEWKQMVENGLVANYPLKKVGGHKFGGKGVVCTSLAEQAWWTKVRWTTCWWSNGWWTKGVTTVIRGLMQTVVAGHRLVCKRLVDTYWWAKCWWTLLGGQMVDGRKLGGNM
jgi:hypothetical protein